MLAYRDFGNIQSRQKNRDHISAIGLPIMINFEKTAFDLTI
jgi:hypothetical protein